MTLPIDPAHEERNYFLNQQITGIMENLASVAKNDRPRFPERHFVGIFLPYFAGDAELPYPQANSTMWMTRVSGSAFQEVDVIDPSGQVLFTVPALMNRDAVNPEADGLPVGHIVRSAQQYAHLSPRAGAAHMREKLTEKALIVKVPDHILRNVEAWNQIFARYGRPPIVALESQPQEASGAALPPSQDLGPMELL